MLIDVPLSSWIRIWQQVPTAARLYALALVVVAIRSLVASVQTWLALRRLRKTNSSDSGPARSGLVALERRCANRDALLQAMFYLFAAIVFISLVHSFVQIGDSTLRGDYVVLLQMAHVFGYAYLCSLLFFAVHVLQWFTASRVAAFARDTNGRFSDVPR